VLDVRRRRGRVSLWAGVQAGLAAGALVTGVAAASPVSSLAAEPAPALAAVQGNRATTIDNGISVGPVQLDEPARTLAARGALTPATTAGTVGPVARDVPAGEFALPASRAPCDPNAGHDNGSHTNWINSDNGSKRWVVQWSDGDCSYEMEARGEVKFNRDVTDIESISSGGSFTLEQHIGDDTKRLVVRPGSGGTLERTYSENGARHEFDAGARAEQAGHPGAGARRSRAVRARALRRRRVPRLPDRRQDHAQRRRGLSRAIRAAITAIRWAARRGGARSSASRRPRSGP